MRKGEVVVGTNGGDNLSKTLQNGYLASALLRDCDDTFELSETCPSSIQARHTPRVEP